MFLDNPVPLGLIIDRAHVQQIPRAFKRDGRLRLLLCQNLKLGLSVIPAQAGIQFPCMDPRPRGNDEPENQRLRMHQSSIESTKIMRTIKLSGVSCLFLWAGFCGSAAGLAEDAVTLENVVEPAPNQADEAVAEEMSLEKAAHFLDSAALTWQKDRKCFTCHTNFAYLYARPAISAAAPAHAQVRAFAEELVQTRWPDQGPRWDAEVVAAAAALAFNDASTTGQLHASARTALDRMWTVQKEDGGFSWLKCDWPPMESDDHYGVTLAAIAVGVAPDDYAATPAAQKGMEGIRRWLKANAPPTLHHQAMLLWANSYIPDLLTDKEKSSTIEQLTALQKADGGWALATLGNWERGDDLQQDLEHSDGYGTGFVLYTLRRADVASSNDVIRRGVKWLKSNQRESGRWYTRSLFKDNHHFISHAGTAMAVLALKHCDEQLAGRNDPTNQFP